MWTDNPPSPCLSVYLGEQIARAIGLRGSSERVQFFVGRDDDAGRVGIKKAVDYSDGDYRCLSHIGGAYRVYLTAQTSVAHFDICPRTSIPASRIELRGQMLVFAYSGLRK
jgi:hypothetical protein